MAIRIKSEDSSIKEISPKEFHRIFGVKYMNKLLKPANLPKDFIRNCHTCAENESKKVGKTKIEQIRSGVQLGRVAPTYIAKISDEVGYGLYAYLDLLPGLMVGEYTGTLTQDWTSELRGPEDFKPYLMKFPFEAPFALNPETEGNEMRFVNHSSENFNVERWHVFTEGLLHVVFMVAKTIPKDGQLLIDYGKNYWKFSRPAVLTTGAS